jgi:Ca-activated chloride channel homolog
VTQTSHRHSAQAKEGRRNFAQAAAPARSANNIRGRNSHAEHPFIRLLRFTVLLLIAFAVGMVPLLYSHPLRALLIAHWEHRGWLLLLLALLPTIWALTFRADTRIARLALGTIAGLVGAPRGIRVRFRDLPAALRVAALAIAILGLSRPQNPLSQEPTNAEGIDIVIALDLSTSMEAVMDDTTVDPSLGGVRAEPRPTRLDTAKEVLIDFIARRKNDRIGIVVFGRAAYILSPPTLDRTVLSNMVRKMELNLVNGNGTAIGDAVGTSVARLRRSTAKSRVIVLLTDGESNTGSVSPEYSIRLARGKQVAVYTVQIGNGDEVEVQRGTNFRGEPQYVRTRYPVNPELLTKMAKETGGEAFIAADRKALRESMHRILDRLEKSQFDAQRAPMEELFPWLLFGAFGLLLLEAFSRTFVFRRFP